MTPAPLRTDDLATARVNGTTLAYLEAGRGEPVVLVHGTLGDARSWTPQIDAFAAEHRTIAYSRRHHHPNPPVDDGPPYSAAVHADDLAALLDALEIGAAHIVGNSYGAYTGLLTAARHPERVRSLVLGEPPVLPLLEDHPEGRHLRDRFLREVWGPGGDLLRRGRVDGGVRIFVDALFGDSTYEGLEPHVRSLVMDNVPAFRLETSSDVFWTPFGCADARSISVPTLLLSGTASLRMFELVVEELERCVPHGEHVRIHESSHDLPSHRVEAFRELVLGFLARNRSDGSG